MKVLIVDDSRAIGLAVSEMLREAHHEFHHVLDGQKAVDFFKTGNQADLVLLDWNMPIMTGVQFLEENFKNRFCNCPIIMMTTENKPSYIQKALELGASEYIMKPFTSDILISKIETVL